MNAHKALKTVLGKYYYVVVVMSEEEGKLERAEKEVLMLNFTELI